MTFQMDSVVFGAALMLVLLGLGIAVIMPGIDRWSKRFFILFFVILILYAGLGLAGELVLQRPDMRPALEVFYYFDSLSSPYCQVKSAIKSRFSRTFFHTDGLLPRIIQCIRCGYSAVEV